MKTNKKILITNDDGINAPGIAALAESLTKIADITVVAPAEEMSATGHAITLARPLRVNSCGNSNGYMRFSVSGTPADCVKLACLDLLPSLPDLVVSGINLGSNTGINALYSGTVSAAAEGAFFGIPSFAISLAAYENPDFSAAALFASQLSRSLIENRLSDDIYLSVNVPSRGIKDIEGIAITQMAKNTYKEVVEKKLDPRGRTYYWLARQQSKNISDISIDEGAIQNNMISVTPLHFDLTHHPSISVLKELNIEFNGEKK